MGARLRILLFPPTRYSIFYIDFIFSSSRLLMMFSFIRTLTAKEVPPEFRDIGVLYGYRYPNLSFYDCLLSLCALHNETFNAWTHVVSCALFALYTNTISQRLDLSKTENQAVLCLLLSCMVFTIFSALAHLFNCMSNTIRNICFMVDYLGISIYAYAVCLANKTYVLPLSWRGSIYDDWFITVMSVLCSVTVAVICITRFMPRTRFTKCLRLMAIGLPYVAGMSPCVLTIFYCHQEYDCESAPLYKQHFIANIVAVIFYAGHIPEILFPGYFDIFFQSHSMFHVFVALAAYYHIEGIMVDTSIKRANVHTFNLFTPSIRLCLFVIVNCFTVLHFSLKFSRLDKERSLKRNS